jgi:hypothetical protein
MSNTEDPVFWDCADGEELHHTDPDDAIECYLNNGEYALHNTASA